MSEKRNSQPDGGQPNEEEHVALNLEPEVRLSKQNLSKSKEKVSADGAEEKLLSKEDEAKIVARVDMADAKFTHSNGDTKIELDANKRQFSGLTKEELLKYADDPLWVNIRWCMFVLFWAMWLSMLAGAIAIIVQAPKCAPPAPKTWYEKGPLVDTNQLYSDVEKDLPQLKTNKIEGIFVQVPDTYDVLDSDTAATQFKAFVDKAKEYGVKVIVDLIPNYVSTSHRWFTGSVNRTAPFADYFVWADPSGYENDSPIEPNKWVSTRDTPAWTFNSHRGQYYLHQLADDQADLDFNNNNVVQEFLKALDKWIDAGASGVRLVHARHMLVNMSAKEEPDTSDAARALDHKQFGYWRHSATADQPQLDTLLATFSQRVPSDAVFTIKEDGILSPELYLLERNVSSLKPPSAVKITVRDVSAVKQIQKRLNNTWPALQLESDQGVEASRELAALAMLLKATPVVSVDQLDPVTNQTDKSETLSELASLRADASIAHGDMALVEVTPVNATAATLIACARWKADHTGYLAVHNPTQEGHYANLTLVPSLPPTLTIYHLSHQAKITTNYTVKHSLGLVDALIPPTSTLVFSYAPSKATEQ